MAKPKRNQGGRPPAKPKPDGQRIFESIGQAAAVLDMPAPILSRLKASGCLAFRGSKIYEADLLQWIEEHGLGSESVDDVNSKSQLECEFLRVRIRRQQHQLDLERADVIPFQDVASFLTVTATEIKQELVKMFRNELAPSLEGLRAQEIMVLLEKAIPRIVDKIRWVHGKKKD